MKLKPTGGLRRSPAPQTSVQQIPLQLEEVQDLPVPVEPARAVKKSAGSYKEGFDAGFREGLLAAMKSITELARNAKPRSGEIVQMEETVKALPAPAAKKPKTVTTPAAPKEGGFVSKAVVQRELQYDSDGNIVPSNMKPKKASNKWEVPGLEVSAEKIGEIDPEKWTEFRYWIIERENIRKKKESGLPPPWTSDERMAGTRWCNVSRNDDKVSRWLYENFYTHKLSPAKMAVAAITARQINRISSLELLYPNGFMKPDLKRVLKIMRNMSDRGEVILSGCYIIQGGAPGLPKYEAVCESIAQADRILKDEHIDTSSFQNTWRNVQMVQGIGSFMGGQVAADLVEVVPGTWKDAYTWAPLGPGSARGSNILFGKDPDDAINQKIFDRRLAIVNDRMMSDPKLKAIVKDRDLKAISRQSLHCETSKWFRLLEGGKSKNRYTGHVQSKRGKLL